MEKRCMNCGWCKVKNQEKICANKDSVYYMHHVENDGACKQYTPINGEAIY